MRVFFLLLSLVKFVTSLESGPKGSLGLVGSKTGGNGHLYISIYQRRALVGRRGYKNSIFRVDLGEKSGREKERVWAVLIEDVNLQRQAHLDFS